MISDLVILAVGLAAGWFAHQYRERLLRFKSKVQAAAEEEFKKL